MIVINVLGKEFALKKTDDLELGQVAQKVQETISLISKKSPELNREQVLLLASLELGKELYHSSDNTVDKKLEEWSSRLEGLCDKIDFRIKESL